MWEERRGSLKVNGRDRGMCSTIVIVQLPTKVQIASEEKSFQVLVCFLSNKIVLTRTPFTKRNVEWKLKDHSLCLTSPTVLWKNAAKRLSPNVYCCHPAMIVADMFWPWDTIKLILERKRATWKLISYLVMSCFASGPDGDIMVASLEAITWMVRIIQVVR